MAKIDIGHHFSFYVDSETGMFYLETREHKPALIIEIPVSTVTQIKDVTWDKETETFEDVAKKKPGREMIYPKEK